MRLFRCFTASGDEREDFYVKKIQNVRNKGTKTINMEPKGNQNIEKLQKMNYAIYINNTIKRLNV